MTVACILTLNAGSSSIKFALFACDGDLKTPLLAGQVEGLGVGPQALTHEQALKRILEQVGRAKVVAVGHRIVHGGIAFTAPALINDAVLDGIAALQTLAPLHQPHNLLCVRAAQAAFPGVPQVACFDTAFHRSMPQVHQHFALPQALHDAGIQRYGFHGLSYESISTQLQAHHPALARGRVVVAHLGNGASMCAMKAGLSVATTMSFSPLDGLTMGSRCGRIDASVALHLIEQQGMTAADVGELLNKRSGLLGLSGLSSDMRSLLASELPAAGLAVEHFVETALHELAGMAAALRGVDALVFTGGIGENAAAVRARIVESAAWMGLVLDPGANAQGLCRISTEHSAVQVLVLHTDEEAVIAGHAARSANLS